MGIVRTRASFLQWVRLSGAVAVVTFLSTQSGCSDADPDARSAFSKALPVATQVASAADRLGPSSNDTNRVGTGAKLNQQTAPVGQTGIQGSDSRLPRAVGVLDAISGDAWSIEFSLSVEKQKYLRDIELLELVLSQDLLPHVGSAIQTGSTETLLGFLASDFEGRVFDGDGDTIQHGPVRVQSWNAQDNARKTLDRKAFVRALVSYGRQFESIEKVKFHVTTMAPEEHENLAGAWRVVWDVHLTGRLQGGRRAEHMLNCTVHCTRFFDGVTATSGWIDRFEVTESWLNSSATALMEEITDQSGIDVGALVDNWQRTGPPYPPVTGGAHLLDFNRDGHVDLLITDQSRLYLYRGSGRGTFEDVTLDVGLATPPGHRVTGALVADLDNDSFEDLVLKLAITRRRPDGTYQTTGRLDVYQNRAGVSFRWLEPNLHNLHQFRFPQSFIGVAVADYNRDGLVDIYVAKSGTRAPDAQQEARWLGDRTSDEGVLMKNLGNWRFADVTSAAGMTGENVDTFAAIWFDMEPDGDPDLFLANHMGPNVLWQNRGNGTFEKQTLQEGFGGFSMGATAGDLDGDGDLDLYIANMYSAAGSRIIGNLRAEDYPPGTFPIIQGFITGNEFYKNDGANNLGPVGIETGVDNSGWAYGPAVVDLDGDGALDIYSPAGFQSVTRGKPDG